MTNREWLETLTDEELRDWLVLDYSERIARMYTSTYGGILQWLKDEHTGTYEHDELGVLRFKWRNYDK